MKNLNKIISYLTESEAATNIDYLQEYFDDLPQIDQLLSKINDKVSEIKSAGIEEKCATHVLPNIHNSRHNSQYVDGLKSIDTMLSNYREYLVSRKELESNIITGLDKDEHTIDWIDSGHTEKEKQIELSKAEHRNTMKVLITNAASMAIPKEVVMDQERITKLNKEYRKTILGNTLSGKYLEWAKQYLDL